MFRAEENGLRISLRHTRELELVSEDGSIVTVRAEPRFEGPTGTQVPDIVLGIVRPGWPQLLVVLDAKYRLDTSSEYVSRFGCPGPPIDAVNALHRYRDAILIQRENQVPARPVVRGAALFPFPNSEQQFDGCALHESLESMGIGALPHLPGSRTLVDEWLKRILSEPVESLAQPGPPFVGQELFRQSQT